MSKEHDFHVSKVRHPSKPAACYTSCMRTLLAAAVTMLLVGCSTSTTTVKTTRQSSAAPSSQESQLKNIGKWTQYTNSAVGFRINYPPFVLDSRQPQCTQMIPVVVVSDASHADFIQQYSLTPDCSPRVPDNVARAALPQTEATYRAPDFRVQFSQSQTQPATPTDGSSQYWNPKTKGIVRWRVSDPFFLGPQGTALSNAMLMSASLHDPALDLWMPIDTGR